MKKLAFAAMLIPSLAYAEIWFEMNNNASGKIILSMEKCKSKSGESGRVAITTSETSPTIFGCWYFAADMVHVFWDNKQAWSYPASDFKVKPDPK